MKMWRVSPKFLEKELNTQLKVLCIFLWSVKLWNQNKNIFGWEMVLFHHDNIPMNSLATTTAEPSQTLATELRVLRGLVVDILQFPNYLTRFDNYFCTLSHFQWIASLYILTHLMNTKAFQFSTLTVTFSFVMLEI